MPGLSVIVPCYNEEGSLEWFLPQLVAVSSGFSDLEVIVVDDASTDQSARILASLASRLGLRVLTNSVNLGFGGALRRGFDAARLDWLTHLPADGQVPAEELPRLSPYLDAYDIIIGRRAATPDYTRYRRIASRVYTTWVSAAFGLRVRDFNWMQAWRRSLWMKFGSRSNSVFICGEFLVRSQRAHARMIEIEIGYRPRRAGEAKNGNPRAALRAAGDILRVFADETRAGQFHFLHRSTPDREDATTRVQPRKAA